MKCDLCGISTFTLTTVKKEISADCKGVTKWELNLCNDCRLDFVCQLIPQMFLEFDMKGRV